MRIFPFLFIQHSKKIGSSICIASNMDSAVDTLFTR